MLRHALGPGSAPALGRVTCVLTLRLRMLVHWACVEALFLAGLGSVMGSVQATSLALGRSRSLESWLAVRRHPPLAFLIAVAGVLARSWSSVGLRLLRWS